MQTEAGYVVVENAMRRELSRRPPTRVRAEVIAMACALPVEEGVSLSRWSSSELAREAVTRGIREQIAGSPRTSINPGSTARGSSPAIPTSPRRAVRSWTSTPAIGRASACKPASTTSCADEKPGADRHNATGASRGGPEGRARVRARGSALLPDCPGCAAREDLRPLRPRGRRENGREASSGSPAQTLEPSCSSTPPTAAVNITKASSSSASI